MSNYEKIERFAKTIYDILISDRDCIIGVGGMTGEGKSICMIQLFKCLCVHMKKEFDYNFMTWDREELLKWVDGDKDGNGMKEEYSPIIADELISMFYKRNWYEDDQKAAVELFNKCRDRHLPIIGGIPNFWDLDGGLLSRIRFYIYIPYRGVAWVFEQENSPFSVDKWNVNENRKIFRKKKVPYYCPNFVCGFHYDDLEPKEKKEYYSIRNAKRKNTENQNKKKDVVKYSHIKGQRDEAIRLAYESGKYTQEQVAERVGLGHTMVGNIVNGLK